MESKSHLRNAGERGKEKKIKKRQEEVGEGNIFPRRTQNMKCVFVRVGEKKEKKHPTVSPATASFPNTSM